jgi:hypothetical protein
MTPGFEAFKADAGVLIYSTDIQVGIVFDGGEKAGMKCYIAILYKAERYR